jgi:hypothetical protein
MLVALRPDLIERLVALPESGMGYQIVDLVLADGDVVQNVTVFNSEMARLPDEYSHVTTDDVIEVRPARSPGKPQAYR